MCKNRKMINDSLTKIMNSYDYCLTVYETGFDTVEQFYSFKQMCQNHVDMCNFYYRKCKPTFWKFQYRKYKLSENVKNACLYTISELSSIINDYMDSYDKAVEEAKIKIKTEEHCRLEHEIAMEYKDLQYEHDKELKKKSPKIGFKPSSLKTIKRKQKINK